MFNSITLRGKLLLASILVEIVMLGLLVGNSVRLIDQHLGQQLEARIQAIELAYKTAVALPLASRDYATLRDILDGWRRAEDVRYLVVTDKQGRTLAASGWNSGQALPPPGPDAQGGDVRNVRFSVDYLGQVYGDVQYGLSTSFIRVAKRELLTQGGMIALTEILTTLVLLSLIGFWLTRHLSALMNASERVAHRATTQPGSRSIPMTRLGNWPQRFNLMAGAVQSRIDALVGERAALARDCRLHLWLGKLVCAGRQPALGQSGRGTGDRVFADRNVRRWPISRCNWCSATIRRWC
jgi:hypothetical protein